MVQVEKGWCVKALEVRVGQFAAKRLEREGWHADLIDGLIGASGGPKWLILGRLDRVLMAIPNILPVQKFIKLDAALLRGLREPSASRFPSSLEPIKIPYRGLSRATSNNRLASFAEC